MTSVAQRSPLHDLIFGNPGLSAYAVLDGAAVARLPERLASSRETYQCLFSGRLDPDLENAAPHLAELLPDGLITRICLEEGWNRHYGVIMLCEKTVDIYSMRKHLRSFAKVESPGGKPMYFRYYDPRVIREVLPELDEESRLAFFGPIQSLIVESEDGNEAIEMPRTASFVARKIALA